MKSASSLLLLTSLLFTHNAMANKEIQTEIIIDATPETVWQILSDWQSYPQWNPFVVEISGEQVVGQTIEVQLKPGNSSPMKMTPVLLAFEPNREFRWRGKLWIKGLFDGEHKLRGQVLKLAFLKITRDIKSKELGSQKQ